MDALSFPRKRESRATGAPCGKVWIPAFAAMTKAMQSRPSCFFARRGLSPRHANAVLVPSLEPTTYPPGALTRAGTLPFVFAKPPFFHPYSRRAAETWPRPTRRHKSFAMTTMPISEISRLSADRAARPAMAVRRRRQGADLVFRRFTRRQPGAHRADGRRSQEPHVQAHRRYRLQGDRGRVSLGLADRFRLCALDYRDERDSRRRRDPGAHPVPAGADRPHLRGGQGREKRHRPFLQLDLDAAARGRVPRRPQGRSSISRSRRRSRSGASPTRLRRRISSSNIRPRVSPAPNSISRSRSARRSRRSSRRRRSDA